MTNYEMIHQFNQYLNGIEEPTRFFIYMLIYVGIPILLFLLLVLCSEESKKKRKLKKYVKERRKKCMGL